MTLIHDPAVHRLGKLPAKQPHLNIAEFVDVDRVLADTPVTVDNSKGQTIPLAMYLNDAEGDCTFAAIGNTLRVNSDSKVQLSDQDVQTGYIAITAQENNGQGYDPTTGANDNGCVELDVLDYWASTGVGGHKLQGHAGVDMKDLNAVKAVTYLFGSVYLGVALATEQQTQQVWDYVAGSSPGSWGGHAIPLVAYGVSYQSQAGLWLVGTWGAYKGVTSAFLTQQADEGHALITPEWLAANQDNPAINVSALTAALANLQHEN